MKIRNDKIWDGYYSVSPLLSKIRMRPQREGRDSSFQDEQGNIKQIDYQKKTVTIQRKLEEARGMTPEDFVRAATEPGAGMGNETMRTLYETLDKVTKETGNSVDAGGGPITQKMFLEIMHKIQFDFTQDGKPIWPTLTLGSAAHIEFQRRWAEWMGDVAFINQLNDLIDSKREEFREREACRRLVD